MHCDITILFICFNKLESDFQTEGQATSMSLYFTLNTVQIHAGKASETPWSRLHFEKRNKLKSWIWEMNKALGLTKCDKWGWLSPRWEMTTNSKCPQNANLQGQQSVYTGGRDT